MRLNLSLLLLILSSFSFAQQSLTKEQINRLANAGKVYGLVKYFNPYLQYKTLNWDSIFAANVERIIQAKNKEEYTNVVQRILAPLNDNLTCVVSTLQASNNDSVRTTSYKIKDSLLYISLNDANDDSFDKIGEACQNLSKVKGVIFDMRNGANSKLSYGTSADIIDWSMDMSRLLFFKGDLVLPAMRTVCYKGLPAESMPSGYAAYFKQERMPQFKGTYQKDILFAFIVSKEDEVPFAAISLQKKGLAVIIQAEGKELTLGRAGSLYIQDSLLVSIRVAEAIGSDGSLTVVHPDAFYSQDEKPDAAIHLAENMIVNGFKKQTYPVQAAPQAIRRFLEPYQEGDYPSIGYRMLAAAKIFSAIDNFYPGKHLLEKNWEGSYRSCIPKFIAAHDSLEYLRAVAELYTNIWDSHGFIQNIMFNHRLNPIIQGEGDFIPPVITDVVENKLVVTGIYNDSVCRKAGIKKWDIILSIDGHDPMKQVEEARKYQPASTKASQIFYVSKFVLFGSKGQIRKLQVQGSDGIIRNVNLPTLRELGTNDDYMLSIYSRHLKPTFYFLTKDIGYADLTSPLSPEQIDSMFNLFRNTKAIVFEDRGFPHFYDNTAWYGRLYKNKNVNTTLWSFNTPEFNNNQGTQVDIQNAKDWVDQTRDTGWVYKGKIVILINESAQSAAENLPLILKSMSNSTFIGSPTAGALAMTTSFIIPGNLILFLSGCEISYPDGRRIMQRGLQPDIFVSPTIKGIQAGKDEVLERAVKFIQTGK
jgi:C-terminal processing protease CtpA/Prc